MRLPHELEAALERQAATAAILKTIATSRSDIQPVFDAIASYAKRLLHGHSATVWRYVGDMVHLAAYTRTNPMADDALRSLGPFPFSSMDYARPVLEGIAVQVSDTENAPLRLRELGKARDFRSLLLVPLICDGKTIGTINVARATPGTFAEADVELLGTFADQAVIAIDNARLFNQTQQALAQQTASADILRVISLSPTDVQPVFDAIVLSAVRLLGCDSSFIQLCDDATFWPVAEAGSEGPRKPVTQRAPIDPDANFPSRAIITRKSLLVPDWSAVELPEHNRHVREQRGFNSAFYLPLLRDGKCVGLLSFASTRANAFGDSEIALAVSFRDQALIAIENTRLFNETKEALERQTATSNILKVIAGSPTEVQPVFEAIASSANRLLGGHSSAVMRVVDGVLHLAAFTPLNPQADTALTSIFPMPTSATRFFERIALGEPYQEPDTEVAPLERGRQIARERGYRSSLIVPLMNTDQAIGAVSVTRVQPSAFTPEDVQLLQTFADQAVIAIENARLFKEVQAKTNDLTEALTYQTGSANILRVIASSPTDVNPVLNAIVESACELCGAHDAMVRLKAGDELVFSAHHGPIPVTQLSLPINRDGTSGLAVLDQKPVQVHDLLSAEGDRFPEAQERARRYGHRTILNVPLLREGESIGVIIIRRTEVNPFTEKQIALLQTFADQAVIAIGNVRLFDEVQQRTNELSESLNDLRTAQERLIQTEKLASLGQLTAGIAHEIKNPLNFVNNFSALSAELTDELNDVLKPVAMDGKVREEVDELTGLLKDNLEKVVQHGKRADSIVKNMLLHSREGSGEQRPADINALLDESLNLAYHGARAEKPDFNITLRRDLDPDAGSIEVFPQEITRAFINLISNGFYAASKRKAENGDPDFEPVLSVATKNLGNHVEIRIRDNGTGIPSEVKQKIFNPFFTTKPAGEGTGLGLSMSHDIIVKQHGGRIEVDTEPGQFTEFTIFLPRTSNLANNRQN